MSPYTRNTIISPLGSTVQCDLFGIHMKACPLPILRFPQDVTGTAGVLSRMYTWQTSCNTSIRTSITSLVEVAPLAVYKLSREVSFQCSGHYCALPLEMRFCPLPVSNIHFLLTTTLWLAGTNHGCVLAAILLSYATCLDSPTMNISTNPGGYTSHCFASPLMSCTCSSDPSHLISIACLTSMLLVQKYVGFLANFSVPSCQPDCLSIHALIDVGLVYSRQ